jgi:hypothetical protein
MNAHTDEELRLLRENARLRQERDALLEQVLALQVQPTSVPPPPAQPRRRAAA